MEHLKKKLVLKTSSIWPFISMICRGQNVVVRFEERGKCWEYTIVWLKLSFCVVWSCFLTSAKVFMVVCFLIKLKFSCLRNFILMSLSKESSLFLHLMFFQMLENMHMGLLKQKKKKCSWKIKPFLSKKNSSVYICFLAIVPCPGGRLFPSWWSGAWRANSFASLVQGSLRALDLEKYVT